MFAHPIRPELTTALVKESVADRVRRFKENSPRFANRPTVNEEQRTFTNYVKDSSPGQLRTLRDSLKENIERTSMSSCGSVEDILAVLRARATESVQSVSHQHSFADLSEILHDIRTSCSETSRTSDALVLSDERQKVKALLKRLSFDKLEEQEEEDPAAVIARIKQRLQIDSEKSPVSRLSVVQDSVYVEPRALKPSNSLTKDLVEIAGSEKSFFGQSVSLQTEQEEKKLVELSVVSVPVDDQFWVVHRSVESPTPRSSIRPVPLDRNWRQYITTEIQRTRASIYNRIKQESA